MSQWIRLKTKQFIGRETRRPGEWVYVGSQLAEKLLATNQADYGPTLKEDITGNAGVVYVTYGGKAIKAARESIQSLRRFHSDLSVAVVSDTDPTIQDTKFIYHPDEDPGARAAKLATYGLSPYERTLYLDADTVVVSSLGGGFNLLDRFDLVLATDLTMAEVGVLGGEHTYSQQERETTRQELPTSRLTQCACGMVFFRKSPATKKFFKVWQTEWQRWKWRDQGAFLRAIHKTPVRLLVLPVEWNVSGQRRNAMVVHHRWGAARRAEGG